MHAKAMVFDPESNTAAKIMLESNPMEIKALGQQIQNYKNDEWNSLKYQIMLDGLRLKFENDPLKQQLLDTGSKMLFEANKYDFDQGIGCTVDQAVAKEAEAEQSIEFIFDKLYPNPKNSEKITNHLGRLLMKVRNELVGKYGTNYGIDGLE